MDKAVKGASQSWKRQFQGAWNRANDPVFCCSTRYELSAAQAKRVAAELRREGFKLKPATVKPLSSGQIEITEREFFSTWQEADYPPAACAVRFDVTAETAKTYATRMRSYGYPLKRGIKPRDAKAAPRKRRPKIKRGGERVRKRRRHSGLSRDEFIAFWNAAEHPCRDMAREYDITEESATSRAVRYRRQGFKLKRSEPDWTSFVYRAAPNGRPARGRNAACSADEFIAAWNAAERPVREVAQKFGMTARWARNRATRYRKAGFKLKYSGESRKSRKPSKRGRAGRRRRAASAAR